MYAAAHIVLRRATPVGSTFCNKPYQQMETNVRAVGQ